MQYTITIAVAIVIASLSGSLTMIQAQTQPTPQKGIFGTTNNVSVTVNCANHVQMHKLVHSRNTTPINIDVNCGTSGNGTGTAGPPGPPGERGPPGIPGPAGNVTVTVITANGTAIHTNGTETSAQSPIMISPPLVGGRP